MYSKLSFTMYSSFQVCTAVIDGKTCNFHTESQIALETHQSEPHFNKNQRLVCARCGVSTPHFSNFKHHMMDKHGCEAAHIKPSSFFACKLCAYETNTQSRIQVGYSHNRVWTRCWNCKKSPYLS